MAVCIYTFEAFSLPSDLPKSVDFICFSNKQCYAVWQQKDIPLDVLSFSEMRQEKIVKILPWKYLQEYDYAIWCRSESSFSQIGLIIDGIKKEPCKDVYYLPEESIDIDFFLAVNRGNLNIKSQLQKYQAASKYFPQSLFNTDLIAFSTRSLDFKQFSIAWMSETLKESLNDEVSFSYLFSLSRLNALECRHSVEDADCFFKIVIPNYNNGNALERCIESILSQSFKSFKIVIIDDCSTDESINIAKRYANGHPEQIFFLSTSERSYSGCARNIGRNFNRFTSKYTWFVDGDDMLYKDSVLKDLYEKASITNADIISFDCAYIKKEKLTIKKFRVPNFFNLDEVLDEFGIAPWHRIIKTEKVVSFFENCIRRQDLATVFRQYSNCKKMAHLDKVCYLYNVRDYATLSEPIWSLENVYIELMRQSRELPEQYSSAILNYISKYPKVFGWLDEDKLLSQKVVAMASYPLRKDGMLKVMKQLLPQCDHFCLYLNEYDTIPKEINELLPTKEDRLKVTIEIGGENLKDYGKFFWWKRFPGYYITVDDDLEYSDDYVDMLTSRMSDFKNNAALGLHGNDFDVVDGAFVCKKHCHAFLSEEKHDVPVDCLGTGVACFYPANFNFTVKDILQNYNEDNDLDMSVSILVKSDKKMLYRIASEKNCVEMNSDRINFVNPLSDIPLAWEKRYIQYDFWLNRDSDKDKCLFCAIPYNAVDIETQDTLSRLRRNAIGEGADFYVIPIEDRGLLKDSYETFFFKFELVKKFLKRYSSATISPILEKDCAFSFTRENADDILTKIYKIKEKRLKRISDRILKANIKKM